MIWRELSDPPKEDGYYLGWWVSKISDRNGWLDLVLQDGKLKIQNTEPYEDNYWYPVEEDEYATVTHWTTVPAP